MESLVRMPIFDGEASETDSEENINISFYEDNVSFDVMDKVQCLEVNGEDAESGDEKESVSSCSTATTTVVSVKEKEPTGVKVNKNGYQSLLHYKLRESNQTFYNDVEDAIKEFVKDNEKSLTEIDQYISKSQATLENASPILKNLHSQSLSLKTKLETLLSEDFLSNVKILK